MPVGFSGFPVSVTQRKIPTNLFQASNDFCKTADANMPAVKWPMPSKNIDGRMEGTLETSWTEFWCLPLISNSSAVTYNGKIYIFGGLIRSNFYADNAPTNRMWVFDTNDGSITEVGIQPITARYHHAACVYDNKMWIFGGYNSSALSDLWSYDLITGDWIQRGVGSSCPARHRCGRNLVVVNGKILVYGGIDETGTTLGSIWQYDPLTDLWSGLDNGSVFPSNRRDHSSWGYNNKFYMAFGTNSGGSGLAECWEYDPASAGTKWTSIGATTTRSNAVAAMHDDGKVYFVGSGNHLMMNMTTKVWLTGCANYESGGEIAASYFNGRIYQFGMNVGYGRSMIEYLEIDEDRYYAITQEERVWGSRSNHQMCAYKGKIYVMGGRGTSRYNTEWSGGLFQDCTLYEFDTNTKKTKVVANGADNCEWGTMHAFNDKIFMFGGSGNGSRPTLTIRIFDLNTHQWAFLPMMPGGSIFHSSVLWNGVVYVHGGYEANTGSSNCLARMWAFDCTSMKWTKLADGPRMCYGHGAFAYNNKIYHSFGADASGSYSDNIFVYNILSDTWETITPYADATGSKPSGSRYAHEVFGWRNQMFICSGSGDRGDCWELNLNNMTWRQATGIFGTGPGRRSCYEDNVAYILGGRVLHYIPAPEVISRYS
jgi:hypothetical protein